MSNYSKDNPKKMWKTVPYRLKGFLKPDKLLPRLFQKQPKKSTLHFQAKKRLWEAQHDPTERLYQISTQKLLRVSPIGLHLQVNQLLDQLGRARPNLQPIKKRSRYMFMLLRTPLKGLTGHPVSQTLQKLRKPYHERIKVTLPSAFRFLPPDYLLDPKTLRADYYRGVTGLCQDVGSLWLEDVQAGLVR